MANKLLLADGQYEVITVDTTLVGIAGKQYWYRNGNISAINVTYGGNAKALDPDEVIGLVYDGVVWTELKGKDGTSSSVPISTIIKITSSTIPTGFLECLGTAISRTLYPELNALYAVDGYPYGAGDGSTTFNIPNLPTDNPFKTVICVRDL